MLNNGTGNSSSFHLIALQLLGLSRGSKVSHDHIPDYRESESERRNVCMHACSFGSNSLQSYGLSPPGSSVSGILQARILEQLAISSSMGSFQPGD